MENRVQISPKNAFLKIPPRWRREFAEEAVEVVMAEGRYTEIMTRITGLTPFDLTKEPASITPEARTKHKKPNLASPSTQPAIEPAPDYDSFRKMLQDPNSMPSIMLRIVTERGEIGWDDLRETLDIDYGHTDNDKLDGSLRILCLDKRISVDGAGGNKRVFKI